MDLPFETENINFFEMREAINSLIRVVRMQRITSSVGVKVNEGPGGTSLEVELQAPAPQDDAEDVSGVVIGVLTSRPSGRGGAATYKRITINSDGSWQAIGDDIPVICPKLN